MALTTNQAIADQVYLAYFSRPTDTGTLTNFGAGLSNGSPTLAQMQSLFSSAEGVTVYGSTPTVSSVVAKAFELVGRTATASDLNAWNSWAVSANLNIAQLPWEVMKVALATEKDLPQASQIAWARLAVSYQLAEDLSANATTVQNLAQSATTQAAARAVITGVTSFATIATAYPASGAGTASTFVSGAASATGTTFTLTTNADSFTGTGSDDVFNSIDTTLTVVDSISGGTGTDRLNYTDTSNAGGLPFTAISGVETFYIRNIETANAGETYDFGGITGETQVWSDRSTDTVTFDNLATGTTVGLNGDGNTVLGGVTFQMATASDAVTIAIAGGVGVSGTAPTITESGSDGTATTATISSTGAANTVGTVDLANATLTSVTINAATNLKGDFLSQATDQVGTDGAVTISGAATTVELTAALDNTIKTINASGLTAGGIIASLGSLNTQTVTGGTGNDRIKTGGVLTTGSVNAGAGTDTLEVGSAADLATAALGAKYTNFETLRVNDSQDMSVISGITALEINAITNKSMTQLTATQAANVKVLGTQTTGVTIALAVSTGTADVLSITAGTGLTTAAATSLGTLTANGFETINITTNAGPTAAVGTDRTTTVAAITSDKVTTVKLAGTAFIVTNAATTLASTINASELTGSGAATSLGLTIGSTTFVNGSTVTGSNYVDNVTIAAGTEGVTLNLGAGNDLVTADVASLFADGSNDGTINGGDGTDTLTVSNAAGTTMIDTHFFKLSNMEKLVLTNTSGDASITTGTSFNTAFANGATITTGVKATASSAELLAGLATVGINYTLDATDMVGLTAGKDVTVNTGSGADTITITGDATWTGNVSGADGSSIVISTGAGVDTISVTVGTFVDQITSQAITITGGLGADLITKVGTNGTGVATVAHYVMAAGDSTTTAWDKITGFDYVVNAGSRLSDVLQFDGTAAVSAFSASADFGTILSHSITNGIVKFDTAATYATERVISSSNIADVVGYLAANTATDGVVAFTYDSDSNGAVDGTMVFHNGTTDSLVLLAGITDSAGLTATLTLTTDKYIAVA